jgi:hypothetical protein
MDDQVDDKIRKALDLSWAHVDGWMGDRIGQILRFVNRYHLSKGISGDIVEIGIHHGKLFFVMASLRCDLDMCVAIDVFEDQELNIDRSGSGSSHQFINHLNTLFPDLVAHTKIIKADSMSITPAAAHCVISKNGVRLFSVDGGHTAVHVVNDLSIAQELIVPSGIVMLDDFLGPLWPSVTEGFFLFMAKNNVRLAPLLIFQNKLFLTTYSEHHLALDAMRKFLDVEVPQEMASGRWRYSMMCGHKVLCFG